MSQTLRQAAEAVLARWDEQGFVGLDRIDDLRAALSAPDPLDEATEIIEWCLKQLSGLTHTSDDGTVYSWIHPGVELTGHGPRVARARDFLARVKGQK